MQLKLSLASSLMKNDHQEKALKMCQSILENQTVIDDPANAGILAKIGIIFTESNRIDQAKKILLDSVAMDDSNAETWNNLGTLYLRMSLERKDPEMLPKSIDAFDRAIDNDPHLASAFNGRASAFKFSNRANQAIRDWKKAMELQPDFVDVYFNLGITYLEIGEKAEASKILNSCKNRFYRQLSPNDQGRLDRLIAEANR